MLRACLSQPIYWGELRYIIHKNCDDILPADWNSSSRLLLWYILHSPNLSILLISICICNIYIWKSLSPILCVKGRPPFRRLYNLDNAARRFQLEVEILEHSQGNEWIHKYYFGFINLLTEFTESVYATVPDEAISALQKDEVGQWNRFLMKLSQEFELVCSNLMSWVPSPSLDECFVSGYEKSIIA